MKWLPVPTAILLVSGCAPGPLPPIFPGLIGFGLGWLVVGLLVWIGFLLWKKHGSAESLKADYLTEALNAINKRLTILEDKIEALGQRKDRK
jgi:hypothetical protein